jgi:hypothetical protein
MVAAPFFSPNASHVIERGKDVAVRKIPPPTIAFCG